MDSLTELYLRERALTFTSKAKELSQKLIDNKVTGEKLNANIEIVDILYKAANYQEDLINGWLYSDRKVTELVGENAKLKQTIKDQKEHINELTNFMKHE